MAKPVKCPKCGTACVSPGSILIVSDDPRVAAGLFGGLPASAPGQKEWTLQPIRCPKCGYMEMHDPRFDMPDPMG